MPDQETEPESVEDWASQRPAEELLAEQRAKERARADLADARAINKALEKEIEDYQKRIGFLDRLSDAGDPKPMKVRKSREQGKAKPAALYCTLASDWHMEENVRPETVNRLNEYNPEIAQERAENFFHHNLKLLKVARSGWDIRQMLLWLGGDLITGYIHEELEEDNWLSPVEASLLAYETIGSGIEFLLDRSDCDQILIPTSNGNHGRTGKKIRIATSAKNSYEWMLYRFLAKRFAKEKRIKFQISSSYHNIVDVYGFRIRFHHGDGVGYGGGIGGITIPVNRRIGRQAKNDPERVDLDCIGHFHNLQRPEYFIGNGSLIGWNPFADRIGVGYQPPMQASFVIDERYKVVSNFNPVIVSEPQK